MRFPYDKSSKWLIQHHADAILRLGGVMGVESWKAVAAELVLPQKLPDGLIEVRFAGPPDALFRQCRDIIDRNAKLDEHDSLLVVSQILAGLRYNDPALLTILGGRKAMIESPVLKELLSEFEAKGKQQSIVAFLEGRFGSVPGETEEAIRSIMDLERLQRLSRLAG